MKLIYFILSLFIFIFPHVDTILYGPKISIQQLPFLVHGYCDINSLHPLPDNRVGKTQFVFTGIIVDSALILTHCEYCNSSRYYNHRIQAGNSFIPLFHQGGKVKKFSILSDSQSRLRKCYCLMHLQEKLEFGADIQKAPIISPNQPLPKKSSFLVAGWGRTEKETNPKSAEILWSRELRATTARQARDEDCRKFYSEAKQEDSGLFCLGLSDSEKTTFGDQGGPVYSLTEHVVYGMIINGVTDTRVEENEEGRPMLMSELRYAREWIDQMRKREMS